MAMLGRIPVLILRHDTSPEGMKKEGDIDYDVVSCFDGTILHTAPGFDCLEWIKRRFWLELQHPKSLKYDTRKRRLH